MGGYRLTVRKRMTKLVKMCPAMLLGLVTIGVRAQVSAYLNPIVTRLSNSQVDTGTFAYLGNGNTSAIRGGVAIGASYMFRSASRVQFGLDMRDEWQGGGDSLLNSFLVGGRAAYAVTDRLRPYLQVSGGVGTTRAPFTAVRTSKAMAKVYAGVDYRVSPHVDFRAVEIGFGELTTASDAQYNSALSYPADTLISFSSGLVFRFGK